MPNIEEYFKNVSPSQKAEFERLRKIVRAIVPDAEETVSYGIPTFKHKGKYLLYFGAFKDHMSVYPVVGEVEKALGDKISEFRSGKGTLKYTEDKLIPKEVIETMVLARKALIEK